LTLEARLQGGHRARSCASAWAKSKARNAHAITAKENDFAHPTKLEARSAEAFTYFFFGGGLGP
jgi:hypothetical protein